MSWSGQSWGPAQPRFVADLTGDGRTDIVGFGLDGVWASGGLVQENCPVIVMKRVFKSFQFAQNISPESVCVSGIGV
jgi:hypothetical protein